MCEDSQNGGFADVDRSDNPQFFVNCLDEQYAKNSILRKRKLCHLIWKKYGLRKTRSRDKGGSRRMVGLLAKSH
jgi:hypothetical protein